MRPLRWGVTALVIVTTVVVQVGLFDTVRPLGTRVVTVDSQTTRPPDRATARPRTAISHTPHSPPTPQETLMSSDPSGPDGAGREPDPNQWEELLRSMFGIPHNAWYRGSPEGIGAAELSALSATVMRAPSSAAACTPAPENRNG